MDLWGHRGLKFYCMFWSVMFMVILTSCFFLGISNMLSVTYAHVLCPSFVRLHISDFFFFNTSKMCFSRTAKCMLFFSVCMYVPLHHPHHHTTEQNLWLQQTLTKYDCCSFVSLFLFTFWTWLYCWTSNRPSDCTAERPCILYWKFNTDEQRQMSSGYVCSMIGFAIVQDWGAERQRLVLLV